MAGRSNKAPRRRTKAPAPPPIAKAWATSGMPAVLSVAAIIYLASVWLNAAGSDVPYRLLPRWGLYFSQIACLFPRASIDAIDYRAEGWVCARRAWTPIEVRRDFPMHADDKESRFQRVMYFYRRNRLTMRALDAYLTTRYDARVGPGASSRLIGGVRLLDVRIPIPKPGAHVDRFVRKPLSAYPKRQLHYFYWTPESMRRERCAKLLGKKGAS